ncbi:Frataxin, mitochondrial [Galdieria sulphuraria]|nr:Frataxin, mitochondrial [Galdieria sulphuraria]
MLTKRFFYYSVTKQYLNSFLLSSIVQLKKQKYTTETLSSSQYATAENWSEQDYIVQAEKTLEDLYDCLAEQGYEKVAQFDVELSQGVLTFKLDENRTYVLNTQRPNRQLWLSSPFSGPWRFSWNFAQREWKATRTGIQLRTLLSEELKGLVGIDIPTLEVS